MKLMKALPNEIAKEHTRERLDILLMDRGLARSRAADDTVARAEPSGRPDRGAGPQGPRRGFRKAGDRRRGEAGFLAAWSRSPTESDRKNGVHFIAPWSQKRDPLHSQPTRIFG